MNLKCNMCWKSVVESSYITPCEHLFCQSCGENFFRLSNPTCPKCVQPLQRDKIVKTSLAPTPQKLVSLYGLPPAVIMNCASQALRFHDFQKKLEAQKEEQKRMEIEEKMKEINSLYDSESQNKDHQSEFLRNQIQQLESLIRIRNRENSFLKEKIVESEREETTLKEMVEGVKEISEKTVEVEDGEMQMVVENGESYGSSVLNPPEMLFQPYRFQSNGERTIERSLKRGRSILDVEFAHSERIKKKRKVGESMMLMGF